MNTKSIKHRDLVHCRGDANDPVITLNNRGSCRSSSLFLNEKKTFRVRQSSFFPVPLHVLREGYSWYIRPLFYLNFLQCREYEQRIIIFFTLNKAPSKKRKNKLTINKINAINTKTNKFAFLTFKIGLINVWCIRH